ncbi:MAG TPA: D-alanyl-D-alanine carboxypeptidase family protein [Xanthobacteraceae bacterium]|nr:D-alanyl-D-alanine carboxypeptidase family protein [Xanthobacteraceae bacterium]
MRANYPALLQTAICRCVMALFSAGAIALAFPAHAQFQPNFQINASHAILVDHESGTVLFEKNPDEPWPPASLAKLMTMEIVFNEIKNGELKLEEELVVSVDAWRRGGAPAGGSTMFAPVHSRIAVVDLIQGAVVQSGNDACIVFAESIAGNEDLFSRMMNARAKELGLRSANFRNSTGLPDSKQVISVRDLATLASHLIRTYPEFYKFYGQPEFTWNKIRQQNRNPLLEMNIGADGLKTGYIKESGYGLVGSAVQEGQRLIVVVHGAETPKDRANDAKRLLEWGFRSFESRRLFSAGVNIAEVRVFGGDSRYVPVIGKGPIHLLSPRGGGDKFVARVHYRGPVTAPIAKGDQIARLRVMRGDNIALEVPLYAAADIGEGSLIQRALDSTTEIAGGWIRRGINKVLKN